MSDLSPASLDRHDTIRAVNYAGGALRLLDQRELPFTEAQIECRNALEVAKAIKDLVVRGAPAIGIAAAWGVVLQAALLDTAGQKISVAALDPTFDALNAARPTAVNLAWALARMRRALEQAKSDPLAVLAAEARAIQDEDLAANRKMGEFGAGFFGERIGVLTHCNTGSLATAGFGTALGVIRAGYAGGKVAQVYAGETRPWLQGARLTMWELVRDRIPAKLIADSAASHLMKSGAVQWIVVGADRIAANGDTANKIGTYQLAISAKRHGVKFMVVAPWSTVDMQTKHGDDIEIELRDPAELLSISGKRTVVDGADAWNPVFDVTPAELIDVIVTERGSIERPNAAQMQDLLARG
ncbi:MAG: S-methyl-5-thioribose-1-phosphate isomerase [Rudaea sp.]|uniref:S-methyl-5-thioribose-1-phosphate isomerase n=1 Tax=unclassified Rudaea TaxID=2627037 RepID=UPI0010F5F01C|nr:MULTISPECIES: S-methyl-5-thioribose-1-phosphate isomerase [unclassified Rudaea]MBN8888242.1 S-methyl-5-thioribose-1-phosphate isomerase [Rudaea sp.]